ncbi:MAG: head-tail adaptor protein [Oscillospiraceae bacterium]|nr:head-tail adaptor protein [Oscillospiraceae bacterium]
MSKSANPGELRTPVYFKRINRGLDGEGYPQEAEVNVFGKANGKDVPCMCKWVNAHGTEVFQSMQLEIREPATITTRFSRKLLDPKLIIYKGDDPLPYEVISIDNVEERGVWLEIKVQRRAGAR